MFWKIVQGVQGDILVQLFYSYFVSSYKFPACTAKILGIRHSKQFVDSVSSGQVAVQGVYISLEKSPPPSLKAFFRVWIYMRTHTIFIYIYLFQVRLCSFLGWYFVKGGRKFRSIKRSE